MARSRRGSFGLQPRTQANVTNQIIALAREYVAKRDTLIMDAWRNGGTFEGKKATDEMVLAYWKERGRDLDKDDPEYEASKNNVMQLEYAVAQSKADLQHVQGKLSDMEYAQFFLRWAKKVPKNSEFYRVLQKDAAQLIEQAKERARIDGERRRIEAFNKFVSTTTQNSIAIGDALTRDLDALSKKTGLSITGNGDELLALLTQNVAANPDQHRRLLDTIKAADPDWNGQLTEGYFTKHIKEATDGYELIADRAQREGFISAYSGATEGMANMAAWGQSVKVWPVAQSYTVIENTLMKVWSDPNASQMDKIAASNAAAAAFQKLANTPGIDAGSKTMIEADAQRLLGQDAGDNPSFGTTMLGRSGVTPEFGAQVAVLQQSKMAMDANPTAFAYAPVDAAGQFDPTGQGPLGIVMAGSVPPGAQGVMVPGADGKAVLAMVMPHSVYTTDPNNPGASPKLAGYQISYKVGGRTVEMWGYRDERGGNHWSLTSPVAEGAITSRDNKGDIYVTPRASASTDPFAKAVQIAKIPGMEGVAASIVQQLRAQQAAGAPLGNVSVSANQLDASGRVIGSVELSYNNGTFTATQKNNTLDANGNVISTNTTPIDISVNTPEGAAFSPSRLSAGDIPGVTFTSPLQASVKAAQYTQTQDQVNRFAADPAFQQAFLTQTMNTLGTTNPLDPRLADAWKGVTTPTQMVSGGGWSPISVPASQRADLQYPGVQKVANQGTLSINFGKGNELTLPGLPSYVGNMQANLQNSFLGKLGSAVAPLLPSLGTPMPPQQGIGTPAATITPTQQPKPSPAPGAPSNVAITSAPAAPTVSTGAPPPTAAPPPVPISNLNSPYWQKQK